jgi:hypothetical protein
MKVYTVIQHFYMNTQICTPQLLCKANVLEVTSNYNSRFEGKVIIPRYEIIEN